MKTLVREINIKELRWDYFRGSGKGGQKRNKTENCARCTHEDSGAQAKAEDSRSKSMNKTKALKRMTESKEFVLWVRNLLKEEYGNARKYHISIKEESINIYDLGEYIPPKRKEIKRKPVQKDKLKEQRRDSKKDLKKYLG